MALALSPPAGINASVNCSAVTRLPLLPDTACPDFPPAKPANSSLPFIGSPPPGSSSACSSANVSAAAFVSYPAMCLAPLPNSLYQLLCFRRLPFSNRSCLPSGRPRRFQRILRCCCEHYRAHRSARTVGDRGAFVQREIRIHIGFHRRHCRDPSWLSARQHLSVSPARGSGGEPFESWQPLAAFNP